MAVDLIFVRIDDRLMHGQVAVGWAKSICPDHIIVANDMAAGDPVQKMLIEMASPPQCALTICEVKEVVSVCLEKSLLNKRILLLFATSGDVLSAVRDGLEIKRINIGGMRYSPGKRQVMQAVAIDDGDEKNFLELMHRKIEITIQMVPTDEPVPVSRYIKN